MNNTTWAERKEILYLEAEHPDVPEAFFIVTIVWLSTCGAVGIFLNGVVLGAFFKNKSVSIIFTHHEERITIEFRPTAPDPIQLRPYRARFHGLLDDQHWDSSGYNRSC